MQQFEKQYLQYSSLRKLTQQIKKVLNKAQDQFQERHKDLQQGYITDLRQYCRIVTVCEEQLILNLGDYGLEFIGEIIKILSGFHLLLISNLLNWIQKFELFLSPRATGYTPFEQLLEQSLKNRSSYCKIEHSNAAKQINEIHDSMQNLAATNKKMIESHNTGIDNPNAEEVIDSVTQDLKESIRNNSKTNSKTMIKKLLSNQRTSKKVDQFQQTDLNFQQVVHLEQQNLELKLLIDNTCQQYETKIKEYILKYKESKLIMKGQKYEIDHLNVLLEVQKLSQHERKPQKTMTQFVQVPTIAEKNRRISIEKNNSKLLFSNIKLRSSSLPRIDGIDESMMRHSFSKIGVQLSKNLIPKHELMENFKKYTSSREFSTNLAKACSQVNMKIPSEDLQNEVLPWETRLIMFSKLCTILKEKHQFCFPQCDHLHFLQ